MPLTGHKRAAPGELRRDGADGAAGAAASAAAVLQPVVEQATMAVAPAEAREETNVLHWLGAFIVTKAVAGGCGAGGCRLAAVWRPDGVRRGASEQGAAAH